MATGQTTVLSQELPRDREAHTQPPGDNLGLCVTQALHCAISSHIRPTRPPESLPLTDEETHAQRQGFCFLCLSDGYFGGRQ